MGWSYCGKDRLGRDIGYGVDATCDYPKCKKKIDRGLGCLCGEIHGDDLGCNKYFCGDHLTVYNRCLDCMKNYKFQEDDDE